MKKYLLDSSFVMDLLNEMADNDDEGPALRWLKQHRRAHLWVSPVTLAEVLEGAEDHEAVKVYLGRYAWQGIHRMQAERVALRQKRAAVRRVSSERGGDAEGLQDVPASRQRRRPCRRNRRGGRLRGGRDGAGRG